MFSNVQPEVLADIPSQFFSEIGIRSNLERAEIDYHDIKVANDTASTATATGFAATDDGVLRGMEVFLSRSQLGDDDNAPRIESKVRTGYIDANYRTSYRDK